MTHMVIKSTKREDVVGVQIGDKDMHFGQKSGAFTVSDPGVAREIEAQHGGRGNDVVVIPQAKPREAGHRYFFGSMPEMPWKKQKGKPHDPTD
jgi:hypothetical protein